MPPIAGCTQAASRMKYVRTNHWILADNSARIAMGCSRATKHRGDADASSPIKCPLRVLDTPYRWTFQQRIPAEPQAAVPGLLHRLHCCHCARDCDGVEPLFLPAAGAVGGVLAAYSESCLCAHGNSVLGHWR